MEHLLRTIFLSLGIGFAAQLAQEWLQSQYFIDYLKANLIILLVALLAINSATLGILINGIKDVSAKQTSRDRFASTYEQILISIKEQVGLICAAVLLLTMLDPKVLPNNVYIQLSVKAAICGVFAYAIIILYDIVKSALIVNGFDKN